MIFEMGRTVVEGISVGRPAGEYLQFVAVVLDDAHLVGLGVIEYKVRLSVLNLNLTYVLGVERLSRTVRREGDYIDVGVP